MSELLTLFAEFNKKYKSDLFTMGTTVRNCPRIPFSSPGANRILYGGIPRGRVTEFFGEEQSGKTTTALDIVANAQKLFKREYDEKIEFYENLPKMSKEQSVDYNDLKQSEPLKCLWIDCENTFDEEWAETLGVDVKNLGIMKSESQSAEEIFDMLLQLLETGEVGLCVLDSIGMMVSSKEMEKKVDEATYGGISQALTKFSKKVETVCAKTGCAFIGINQVRDNLNAGYGGPLVVTPGGKCWKHVCSVRLEFRQGTPFDNNFKDVKKSFENPYGHKVMIRVVKTKVCKPDRKLGEYTLTYYTGIEPLIDLVSLAISYDIIHQSKAWFTIIDPESGEVKCRTLEDGTLAEIKLHGQQEIYPFLQDEENSDILKYIEDSVNNKIS